MRIIIILIAGESMPTLLKKAQCNKPLMSCNLLFGKNLAAYCLQ